MKLKLTDSPGIAGGFYWINPKKTDTESISLYPFLSNLGRFDLMLLMYNNGTNIPAAMKQIPSILQK